MFSRETVIFTRYNSVRLGKLAATLDDNFVKRNVVQLKMISWALALEMECFSSANSRASVIVSLHKLG